MLFRMYCSASASERTPRSPMFSSHAGSLSNARTNELSDSAASRSVRRGVARICVRVFIKLWPDYDAMAVQPASLEVLEKAAVPPAQARLDRDTATVVRSTPWPDGLAARDRLFLRDPPAALTTHDPSQGGLIRV